MSDIRADLEEEFSKLRQNLRPRLRKRPYRQRLPKPVIWGPEAMPNLSPSQVRQLRQRSEQMERDLNRALNPAKTSANLRSAGPQTHEKSGVKFPRPPVPK